MNITLTLNWNVKLLHDLKKVQLVFFAEMAPVVLMVAEKPSLALSLAKILSNNNGLSSRKASNGACSVHEWNGKFQGQHVFFKMTSVCGHVMSCDFPPKYNNWDKVDPVSDCYFHLACDYTCK